MKKFFSPSHEMKKIRYYDASYLELGFTHLKDNKMIPQCIFCGKTLANESMRPVKPKKHFDKFHDIYSGRPRQFFLEKLAKFHQKGT